MYQESNSGVTIEQIYLLHIQQIGLLAKTIYFSPRSEWQVNALNYVTAVDHLEAVTAGDLTKECEDKIKKLTQATVNNLNVYRENRKDKNEAYMKQGRNYEMRLSLEYAQKKLALIMKDLVNNGKLRQRNALGIDIEDNPPELEEETGIPAELVRQSENDLLAAMEAGQGPY